MGGDASLEELRKDVTRMTLEIVRLCGERSLLTRRIGEIKARRNLQIENLKVEEDLKNDALKVCRDYGVDAGFCLKLLELLLNESKRVQK